MHRPWALLPPIQLHRRDPADADRRRRRQALLFDNPPPATYCTRRLKRDVIQEQQLAIATGGEEPDEEMREGVTLEFSPDDLPFICSSLDSVRP